MTYPTVILLRHGRTQWNADLRWQGKTDIPLDEAGLEQAERAAEALAQLNPTAIVSSDLQRAHRTAGFLAELTGLEIQLDPRLRETDGGIWEGMVQADIRANYAEELKAWFSDPDRPAGLTGESPNQVGSRIQQAVTEHAAALAEGTLVVSTHGGAARMGIIKMLGIPMTQLSVFRVLNNCAWAVLEHDGPRSAWQLTAYNQSASTPLFESHI